MGGLPTPPSSWNTSSCRSASDLRRVDSFFKGPGPFKGGRELERERDRLRGVITSSSKAADATVGGRALPPPPSSLPEQTKRNNGQVYKVGLMRCGSAQTGRRQVSHVTMLGYLCRSSNVSHANCYGGRCGGGVGGRSGASNGSRKVHAAQAKCCRHSVCRLRCSSEKEKNSSTQPGLLKLACRRAYLECQRDPLPLAPTQTAISLPAIYRPPPWRHELYHFQYLMSTCLFHSPWWNGGGERAGGCRRCSFCCSRQLWGVKGYDVFVQLISTQNLTILRFWESLEAISCVSNRE